MEWLHKTYFHGRRSAQFELIRGYIFLEVTERLFMTVGYHSSLWPKATTFEKLQNSDNLVAFNMFIKAGVEYCNEFILCAQD